MGDSVEQKSKDMVSWSDDNVSRLPLVRQRARGKKNGPWEVTREGWNVSGSRHLTFGEFKVHQLLLAMFKDAGMPESGEFFDHVNSILKTMQQFRTGKKTLAPAGTFQKKWLKKSLLNLNKTVVHFDGCYELNGVKQTSMVTFALIERVDLFERESSDQYVSLSRFRFPREMVENIRAGKTKAVNLQAIMSLNSETAGIIYLRADRMLGHQEHFHKDLAEFCDSECLDFGRPRDRVKKMKAALKKIIGLPTSSGHRIAVAELRKSDTPSGWKVYFARGIRRALLKPAATVQPASARSIESVAPADREEQLLKDFYAMLSIDEKRQVDASVPAILKELFPSKLGQSSPLSLDVAKMEAIRRFSHDIEVANMTRSVGGPRLAQAREPHRNTYAPAQCIRMVHFAFSCDVDRVEFLPSLS